MANKLIDDTNRLFGTDGIRAKAGTYPLSDGMLFKIGRGVVALLGQKHKPRNRYTVILGKDTRLSGQRIEYALSEALNAYGVDVLLAGTIPTPGLSYLAAELKSDMGIMISASHNKPSDNGIKLIGSGGKKISLADEECLEELIVSGFMQKPVSYRDKGKTIVYKGGVKEYADYVIACFSGLNLDGYNVAVDCAWGAAAGVAVDIFAGLGARVSSIHDFPSGGDINAGGVSDISYLRQEMKKKKNDIGIAFDGDGDRLMLVDELGALLDGDHIMAIIALYFLRNEKLKKNTLVATVASNQGLTEAIEAAGGKVIMTSIGDKYVAQALEKNDCNLGGEQAGQIICRDYSPVPDAFIASALILKIMKETGLTLSELAKPIKKIPQVTVNVAVSQRKPFHKSQPVWGAITRSQKRLQGQGRLLVRYSGTEDLARIMVEGMDERLVSEIAQELGAIMRREMGANGS
jgi:phosphoglucosamine mutase